MRGAGVIVLHAVILVGGFNEVEHGLKLADIAHIAIDMQEFFLGEILLLVLDGLLVLVDRNRRKRERFRLPDLIGIDK
ncbi:hypothetical protein SDC9_56208 [bioreactor metagenome]|uniref:Uncharacterized protein n=1 Tax=bioreactor metagenome TaxID=1076179 RepID=A0A644X144_9ZZZZ